MTDNEFLLWMLQDRRGWVSRDAILRESFATRGCGLTVHSRAADLRKRGHVVVQRSERAGNGRVVSYYRLERAAA